MSAGSVDSLFLLLLFRESLKTARSTHEDSNSRFISNKTDLKIRQLRQLKYLQRYYFTQRQKSNIFVNIYI